MIKPFGNNVLLKKITESSINGIIIGDANFSYVVYASCDEKLLAPGTKVYLNVQPEKLELDDETVYVTDIKNILAYEVE